MKEKPPIATRLLSWYLLYTVSRSLYTLYLGQSSADYRLAWEAGFGPGVWFGEGLYALLATGAFIAISIRVRQTVPLILASLAVSTALTIFQLQQVEANPDLARRAYAESRRVRGYPVSEDRLDTMFAPSGRRLTWAIGALFTVGPLVLLLIRRRAFAPRVDDVGAPNDNGG